MALTGQLYGRNNCRFSGQQNWNGSFALWHYRGRRRKVYKTAIDEGNIFTVQVIQLWRIWLLNCHLGRLSSWHVWPSFVAGQVVTASVSTTVLLVRLSCSSPCGFRCPHDNHLPANCSTLLSLWENSALQICSARKKRNPSFNRTVVLDVCASLYWTGSDVVPKWSTVDPLKSLRHFEKVSRKSQRMRIVSRSNYFIASRIQKTAGDEN